MVLNRGVRTYYTSLASLHTGDYSWILKSFQVFPAPSTSKIVWSNIKTLTSLNLILCDKVILLKHRCYSLNRNNIIAISLRWGENWDDENHPVFKCSVHQADDCDGYSVAGFGLAVWIRQREKSCNSYLHHGYRVSFTKSKLQSYSSLWLCFITLFLSLHFF